MSTFKGRIRDGAVVGQDHGTVNFYGFYGHEHRDTVFEFTPFAGTLFKGVARGFGDMTSSGAYGNGALFVNIDDIVRVEDSK